MRGSLPSGRSRALRVAHDRVSTHWGRDRAASRARRSCRRGRTSASRRAQTLRHKPCAFRRTAADHASLVALTHACAAACRSRFSTRSLLPRKPALPAAARASTHAKSKGAARLLHERTTKRTDDRRLTHRERAPEQHQAVNDRCAISRLCCVESERPERATRSCEAQEEAARERPEQRELRVRVASGERRQQRHDRRATQVLGRGEGQRLGRPGAHRGDRARHRRPQRAHHVRRHRGPGAHEAAAAGDGHAPADRAASL